MKYVFRKPALCALMTGLDYIGYRTHKNVALDPESVEIPPRANFLVMRLDHLGDVLSATAVPGLLKSRYPQCKISFLTASWSEPLLRHNPHIDEQFIYDAPWFRRGRYSKASRSLTWRELIRVIRASRFDAALSLRGDLRENYLAYRCGIPVRIGYGITGGGFLLTHELSYDKSAHESAATLNILKPLGVTGQTCLRPDLYFSPEEREAFSRRARAMGVPAGSECIGILLHSGSAAKDWPMEKFRQLIALIQSTRPGLLPVLVGLKTDGGEIRDLSRGGAVLDIRGKTTVRELALWAQSFRCFVGPDSGPTHLANAVGTPTVFLYSQTNQLPRWRPLYGNHRILRTEMVCSEVMSAIEELLS